MKGEEKMKKLLTLLLCLCMILALFTACGNKTEKTEGNKTDIPDAGIAGGGATSEGKIIEAAAYKDVFRIGGQMEFPTLDFHESLNAHYIVTLTHDTLITRDGDDFVPALATEWKKIDSKTWEFKLREGVTFHDGSKFTADDVVFTMERGLDNPSSNVRARLSCIEKVEAIDEYNVRFNLNAPNQDFLLCISQGYASIMSKDAVTKDIEGVKYGTGPWKVTEFKPSISVTMERYDGFWGEAPKAKQMVYVTYPEDPSRLVALQSGEIDCCLVVNAADNKTCETDDRIVPVTILDSGFAFLAFNMTDPILSDINFRKACAYAINPEDVLAVSCEGYGVPVQCAFGGGAYGSAEGELEGYYYDPELAKEYLAKSCYNGEELTIMCGVQEYVTNATIYADMLGEIGIKCVLEEKDFLGVATSATYDKGEHQLLSWAAIWSASGDDVRRLFYTGQRSNYTCVPNEELDKLIDDALYEEDDATRKDLYRQIQQYVIDNCLMVPVYRSTYYCAEAPNVSGIKWSSDCNDYNFRYGCVAILD